MSDKMTALMQPRTVFLKAFVVVFLIILCATVAVTFLLPDTYASTARIKVEGEGGVVSGMGNAPAATSFGFDPYFIQTQFEIMQSQVVLEPVIHKLNLNVEWGKKYSAGKTLTTAESLEILKARVTLVPVRNTKLVSIMVYSDDKKEAAQIANAIAESYRDYRVNSHTELTAKGIDVLQQEYQEQEAQIRQGQSDLDSIRQKFDIPDVEASSPAEFALYFDKDRAEAEKTYRQQLVQWNELQKLGKDQLRDVLPGVSPDTALFSLLDKLHEARRQYHSLTNDYLPENEHVSRVTSLIGVLNHQIDDRVAGIMAGLKSQIEASRAALDSLAARVETAKAAQPYWDKKRDLDQMIGFHKLLAAKIETERLDAKIPKTTAVQVVDKAEPGKAPVRPNKALNITFGIVFGIILASVAGGIAAFIALRFRKRIGKTAATV